jgi:hypothetical protein
MRGNKFGCVRRSSNSTKGNNPPNKQMYTCTLWRRSQILAHAHFLADISDQWTNLGGAPIHIVRERRPCCKFICTGGGFLFHCIFCCRSPGDPTLVRAPDLRGTHTLVCDSPIHEPASVYFRIWRRCEPGAFCFSHFYGAHRHKMWPDSHMRDL